MQERLLRSDSQNSTETSASEFVKSIEAEMSNMSDRSYARKLVRHLKTNGNIDCEVACDSIDREMVMLIRRHLLQLPSRKKRTLTTGSSELAINLAVSRIVKSLLVLLAPIGAGNVVVPSLMILLDAMRGKPIKKSTVNSEGTRLVVAWQTLQHYSGSAGVIAHLLETCQIARILLIHRKISIKLEKRAYAAHGRYI